CFVTSSAVIVFWLSSAALAEPEICYVLDGILFLYGIILTALYCRIKVCMLHVCLTRNLHGQELNINKYMYIKDVSHIMYIVYCTIFLCLLQVYNSKGAQAGAAKVKAKQVRLNTHGTILTEIGTNT
uniref:Uncharacterized protein n=1 Tax=Sparus aurata TaxID=8175 RepID=A0A671U790_SPAAU